MVNIPELKRGVLDSVVDAIGNTPIVRLNNLTRNLNAEVDVKMESFNPTGSVKDRVAVSMIEDAEKRGLLDKDSVIIEPTSGNTGIGLGFAAAAKGYRLILTMPENSVYWKKKIISYFWGGNCFNPVVMEWVELLKKQMKLKKKLLVE